MHLPIQERLTLGNADLRGAVLGCPSIQDAPPLRPSLGSPSIQSTHCPEAGQHQCNEENLGSNCPKQRTQSKKCSKKDCWLQSTTSVQNHFQTAVSGCWQEPDDIHTLGQGGNPERHGLWSSEINADGAHLPQIRSSSPGHSHLSSSQGSFQNPA